MKRIERIPRHISAFILILDPVTNCIVFVLSYNLGRSLPADCLLQPVHGIVAIACCIFQPVRAIRWKITIGSRIKFLSSVAQPIIGKAGDLTDFTRKSSILQRSKIR
ncbi:hypothetical protein D3C75_1116890 [compost metagenome]